MKKVNYQRVEKLLDGIAKFGKTDKGITRLAYTATDVAAQNWLLEQVQDLNLTVTRDAVGNIFLRKQGSAPQLPPIAMGSHLDSVAQAGAYDGVVGVVGALEVLYMLADEDLTRSLEVIIFQAEESTRFGFATMGSKLVTGRGTPEQFSRAAHAGDLTFVEALRSNGYNPDNYQQAIKAPGFWHSFWELHIEQGKVLDEMGEQIGIVQNIAAPTRFKIRVEGMADHSGATPMGLRKDALVAAAKLILAVQAAAQAEADQGTVATVGVVEVEPASINVIPGQVTLWVDLRGVEPASIARAFQAMQKATDLVAASDQVDISVELLTADTPVQLAPALAQLVEQVCQEQKVSYRYMNSGAGHDAMQMATIVSTGMIFIPCRGGISHNPAEFAKPTDICTGISVLAATVQKLATQQVEA
ncbi:MAG: M20 family metallo-hydrolase [Acidaminococcaceae bacterium]